MRIEKNVVIAMILALITGCAATDLANPTKNGAFIEGQQLIAEGQFDAGLQLLKQAASEEPDNTEIRLVLNKQQEAILAQLLYEADNLRLSDELDAAELKYDYILYLFPRSENAKEGLEALNLERYHIASIEYAKELLARNDVEGAEAAARAVLLENPMQSHARQLIKEISTSIARTDKPGLTLKTAFKKPFTIEFRDTELKSVFEIMAKTAGINFVFDKDIRQETKISIFVRDNNIEDVLNLILMTNQLAYKALNENSLLIYPNTPAKQKEYQQLVVRSFHVAYTDVKQMVAMVRGLVKAKDIYVNEQLNLFVMRDTPEAIRMVERLVSLNDLPEPEIMLEVQVLEIQRTIDTQIGPNLPQSATYNFVPGVGGAAAAATTTLDQISAPGLENFTINNTVSIDFKKDLAQGDLLANPRIRVKNRGQAKILIGERVPIVTSNVTGTAATVSQSVNYIDVGLKLDVEPIISMNNEVAIKLLLEVSTIVSFVTSGAGATATRIPQVGTRTAETLLSLKNGETEVLAGLIQDEDTKNFAGIAGLIDLPILNRLFTNQTKKRKKTEIVMLITPRILRNTKQPTNAESEFHFGTSNMPGKLPVTIGKTAPESLAIATAGSGRGGGSSALSRAAGTFSPSNESQETPNPFARTADASPMISLQAPPRVALDKEFTVRVGLIGAQPSVTSEMELSYDTDMLQALDDGDNSGRREIKLGKDGTGKTEQIRFKVITANPGTAEISVQNIISEDKETSESVEVTEPRAASIIIQ